MKKYIVIAGVNGAGKSTLYRALPMLAEMPRINTDEIVRTMGHWKNVADVIQAGKIAIKKMEHFLANGTSFNQETTLCGKTILKNIRKAKRTWVSCRNILCWG